MSKFLLLLGPSGVGKSTIIQDLIRMDDRFIYISPYMTRPLRSGETDKVSISESQMDEMDRCGEFLTINQFYGGIRYATPRTPIVESLAAGKFPLLDWPVSRINIMTREFPNRLYVVYVLPPSIEVLRRRLGGDNRDADGSRLKSALKELEAFHSSEYLGVYDFEIISEDGQTPKIAQAIYFKYLKSLQQKQ
jgi:guanylate kinase